jgi:hypothetical protein
LSQLFGRNGSEVSLHRHHCRVSSSYFAAVAGRGQKARSELESARVSSFVCFVFICLNSCRYTGVNKVQRELIDTVCKCLKKPSLQSSCALPIVTCQQLDGFDLILISYQTLRVEQGHADIQTRCKNHPIYLNSKKRSFCVFF